ncbi:MAG: helix-turn-helix domain-containing protein, partial [bacterium]
LLTEYPWPGNIRQLKNTIERAVLVECDEFIEAEHISLDSERGRQKAVQEEQQRIPQVVTNLSRIEFPEEGISLEELERNIILSAMEKANGNISMAARLLKINRGKLRYRLERLGLTPKSILTMKANTFT